MIDVVGWIAGLWAAVGDRIFLLPLVAIGLLLIADAIRPGTWPGSEQ